MERHDLPVVVALGALSASVALAFGRVFDSTAYVIPLLGAAVLPHVVAALVRWRGGSAAITWLASGVALVVYVLVAVPGAGSPSGIVDRVSAGWDVVANHGLPLPASHGAVLLSVVVVWFVAAISDDLAFHWHAGLGAIAPGLMVLVWIAALGTHDGLGLTVALFGAAAVVYLALQHQVLLRHQRTRLGTPRVVDSPRFLMGGVMLGVIAVVVGVAIAPAIPGGEDPLFDVGGVGGGGTDNYRTSVPPLLDIGNQLTRGQQEQLFTVRASRGDYWRTTALDEYRSISGGQWTLTAEGDDAVGEGLDGDVPDDAVTQHYRIGSLGERWMPAAYEPMRVSLDDTLVIRSSSTLVTKRDSVSGLRYTVESAPPAVALTAAQRERAAGPVPERLLRYTELPDDFPISVTTRAQAIATGLSNPYDKALALRDFFRSGAFTYDVTVESRDDQSAIVEFLDTRRGFCVQFASAYATMARSLGIPARVAVGFTAGTATNGTYDVTNYDAHAWPEIWLAGVGWTNAFDPTPPSDGPGGSDLPSEVPIAAPAGRAPQQQPTPTTTPATTPQAQGTTPSAPTPTAPTPSPITVSPEPADTGGGTWTWLVIALVAFALLVVTPAAAIVALKARRRARRRAHVDPASAVTGAWDEALADLLDHRLQWPRSDTPRELARRVPGIAGDATAAPLRALADSYGSVRYGGVTPDAAIARRAWSDADALRDALDSSSGVVGRIRARLDPSTLRRRGGPASSSAAAGRVV